MIKAIALMVLILLSTMPGFAQSKPSIRGFKSTVTPFRDKKIKVDLDKQFALIIGINDYKKLPDLDNPVYDAWSFKEILVDHYGYSPGNIFELYDEDAGYSSIIRTLGNVFRAASPDGSVLIYFCGHGHKEKGSGLAYWLPYDVGTESGMESIETDDDIALEAMPKKISFELIRGYLKNSAVKHIFVIADSCYSGELVKERFGVEASIPYAFTERKSRKVLASGLKHVSDGVAGKHSPFAEFLLKTLRKNNKKLLTGRKLITEIVGLMGWNPGPAKQETVGGPILNAGHE
jgi:hypothetical protein